MPVFHRQEQAVFSIGRLWANWSLSPPKAIVSKSGGYIVKVPAGFNRAGKTLGVSTSSEFTVESTSMLRIQN